MNTENWEKQSGGLHLAVTPFDKAIHFHREAASSVMRESVQTIAETHGAQFNSGTFHNNLQALYTGDIRLDLYLAKWEVCERKPPICLGAALSWDTVGLDMWGDVRPALYTEDVCLVTGSLRNLIRAKPNEKEFPEESLLEALERISLRNLGERQGAWFKYGEVNPDNARMMRSMLNSGGVFGRSAESAVLKLPEWPSGLSNKLPMDISVIALGSNRGTDKNNFVAKWKQGEHDIRFVVTRGQATALGQHRVDIRPWHNGNLPAPEIVDCVIASALRSIKGEVETVRKWGQPTRKVLSPAFPVFEPGWKVGRSMISSVGDELVTILAHRPKSFDPVMPDAHVYVINDKPMVDGFVRAGASRRLFGDKAMSPGYNHLRKEMRLNA